MKEVSALQGGDEFHGVPKGFIQAGCHYNLRRLYFPPAKGKGEPPSENIPYSCNFGKPIAVTLFEGGIILRSWDDLLRHTALRYAYQPTLSGLVVKGISVL